jgi:hypothetical protein
VGDVRWQPFAVAVGLAAPPVLLAIAVWPSASAERAGFDDPEAELTAGDAERGSTNGLSSTDYLITGQGVLRIDVDGPTFDPTLTLVDPETGDQLDYNDDSNGLNPSLTVELDEGESVRAQVRSLGGPPGGAFRISVTDAGDGGGVVDDGGGEAGGPATTVPAVGEAFEAPIGDDPIVVSQGGFTVTLREDGENVCLETEGPNGGGSGMCGQSLRDLVQPGGFGGSSDGRTSTIDVVTLVGPEVARAVVVLLDDSEIELGLVALPGRSEQVVVGQVRVPADAFARPGGSGATLVLRDADGGTVDSFGL